MLFLFLILCPLSLTFHLSFPWHLQLLFLISYFCYERTSINLLRVFLVIIKCTSFLLLMLSMHPDGMWWKWNLSLEHVSPVINRSTSQSWWVILNRIFTLHIMISLPFCFIFLFFFIKSRNIKESSDFWTSTHNHNLVQLVLLQVIWEHRIQTKLVLFYVFLIQRWYRKLHFTIEFLTFAQ
jgi:hypothetical protein